MTSDVSMPVKPDGWFAAVYRSDLIAAKAALASGISVDAQNATKSYLQTALHTCADEDNVNMIRFLIEAGASVDKPDFMGNTAMHYAAVKGNFEVMDELLLHKITIDKRNTHGATPLQRAIAANRLDVVQYLIDHGASPNAKNKLGNTALHLAAASGNVEMVQLLLRAGADINARHKYGNTPLLHAADNGHARVVSALIEAGSDITAINDQGHQALHKAVESGSFSTVKELLQAGAKSNVQERINRWTPLHIAVMKCFQDIATLLLHFGASPNAKTTKKVSVLHMACEYADRFDAVTVRELLDYGADLFAQDHAGNTALHVACKLRNQRLIHMLLREGADPHAVNKSDQIAFSLLAESERTPLLEMVFGPAALTKDTPFSDITNARGVSTEERSCKLAGREAGCALRYEMRKAALRLHAKFHGVVDDSPA